VQRARHRRTAALLPRLPPLRALRLPGRARPAESSQHACGLRCTAAPARAERAGHSPPERLPWPFRLTRSLRDHEARRIRPHGDGQDRTRRVADAGEPLPRQPARLDLRGRRARPRHPACEARREEVRRAAGAGSHGVPERSDGGEALPSHPGRVRPERALRGPGGVLRARQRAALRTAPARVRGHPEHEGLSARLRRRPEEDGRVRSLDLRQDDHGELHARPAPDLDRPRQVLRGVRQVVLLRPLADEHQPRLLAVRDLQGPRRQRLLRGGQASPAGRGAPRRQGGG
jgi:hypothetical protein